MRRARAIERPSWATSNECGEPGAEQVALVVQEHLRLVDQPAKGRGMHDAVAVALEGIARGRGRLGMPTAARLRRRRQA